MRATGPNTGFPTELHSVRGKALEDYVHSRILDFALEPSFARRLYTTPARVHAAAKEALAELSRPVDSVSGRELRLVFRHTCQSLGCLNPDCLMCKNTPHRRCATTFAPKYLSGDALKGKCGAPIFVEVLDARGQPVQQDAVNGLHLEICIVEGKAYSDEYPDSVTDEILESNKLLVDARGKEVLGPGNNCESTDDKRVAVRFSGGKAELGVNILGSSIAMLTGQKPQFRLWVRAIDSASSRPAVGVSWAVSEAFVVATQRVKGAQKADIPHVEEHVSKIENVGVQTQHKLQDIRVAASSTGLSGINVIHNCVTTVGQFRDLVESTAKDMPLQESLRKVLNFTSKGWEAAKAHALKAVETDNRMRTWFSDDTLSKGLLFRCHLGRVDIDSPVGLLTRKDGMPISNSQVEVEAFLAQHPQYDRQAAAWLQKKALKSWWMLGHPGWSIWPADSEQFIRGVVEAGDAANSPVQIQAAVPSTPHTSHAHSGVMKADEAGSNPAVSAQAQSPSMALESGTPKTNTGSVSANTPSQVGSFTTNTLGQGDASNREGSRHGEYSQGPRGQSEPHILPRNSESGPSASSVNPTQLLTQSAGSAPPPASMSGWPYNVPLVNAHAMSREDRNLPASPFDLPVATNPATSLASHPLSDSSMNGFSFRPPQNSKTGMPPAQNNSFPPFSILPTLTTQDLDRLIELQRRINSGLSANDSSSQDMPQSYLNFANTEFPSQGDAAFPQFISRLSGLMSDPNLANLVDSRNQPNNNSQYISQFFPSLRTYGQSEGDQQQQMPLKISGKVSGILDDLSDAMTLLNELLPSAASDIQLQAQAAKATDTEGQWPASLHSFPMLNLPSGLQPLDTQQMPMHTSAEGSNVIPKQSTGNTYGDFDVFQPPPKRKRPQISSQEA